MNIKDRIRNWVIGSGELPAVERQQEIPLKEEEEFNFSVLWQEEEPGQFTLPHIVELVFLIVILLVAFFK